MGTTPTTSHRASNTPSNLQSKAIQCLCSSTNSGPMAPPPSNRWHLNNRPTVRTQIISSSIMALSINSRCKVAPNQNWINNPHKRPEWTNSNISCTQINSKLRKPTVTIRQEWATPHTTSKTPRGPPSNRDFWNKPIWHPSRRLLTSRVKTTGSKIKILTHFQIPPWNQSTPQLFNTTQPSPRYRTQHNPVVPPHLLRSACLHYQISECSTTLLRPLLQAKICIKFPQNIKSSPSMSFLCKPSKLSLIPLWLTITSCSPNSSSTRFRRSQISPLQTQPNLTRWTTKSSMTTKSNQIPTFTCKTWSSMVKNKCIFSSHLSSSS